MLLKAGCGEREKLATDVLEWRRYSYINKVEGECV
jgi:hypothetical protein